MGTLDSLLEAEETSSKLTCPKCGNDTFKITYGSELDRRFEILFITCAKCGWNTKKVRPAGMKVVPAEMKH